MLKKSKENGEENDLIYICENMGALKDIEESFNSSFDKIWKFAGKSTSVLVSVTFLVFSVGSLFGYLIAMHSAFSQRAIFLLLIPPLLGILAYYYRAFATICFILFLVLMLI